MINERGRPPHWREKTENWLAIANLATTTPLHLSGIAAFSSCDAHHSLNLNKMLTQVRAALVTTRGSARCRKSGGAVSDNIFLYLSAAITLMVVILSLLTPPTSSEGQRICER